MGGLVAAVDVGTGSARAGILDAGGRLLGRAVRPIALKRPGPGLGEYDSEDIWRAVGEALRDARALAGAVPEAVAGLAFAATCSLVLRDAAGRAVPATPGGDACWDTIAWFDHRARAEAEDATATGHPAVAAQGGAIHPEMQLAKLLWLRRRAPESWGRLAHAFDLADFLGWKATGVDRRSHCTLTCKWGYGSEAEGAWPCGLFAALGLDDLGPRSGLPREGEAVPVGARHGSLCGVAAEDLGLAPDTPVAAGMVDAHAGALGALARFAGAPEDVPGRLAVIAGTSSCVMAFAQRRPAVTGLWGPYRDAVLPGLWMVEGGISAHGALLDYLCRTWLGAEPDAALHARIWARIDGLRREEPDLAARLHVFPGFHGSRASGESAGPGGAIAGLSLDTSFDGFCRLYWRAAIAVVLSLRQVIERMRDQGLACEEIHLGGGLGCAAPLQQLIADATGLEVAVPEEADATLLGAGVVAATAASLHPDLGAAGRAMAAPDRRVQPDPAARVPMERDYRAYLLQQRHRAELEELVQWHAAALEPSS